MNRTTTWLLGGAAALAVVVGGAGIAVAGGDDDVPIEGQALEQASAAALAHTGEGRVTETEVGDEEGYYEVEVTLDNDQEVDVHLDESFTVLGVEQEDDEPDDD